MLQILHYWCLVKRFLHVRHDSKGTLFRKYMCSARLTLVSTPPPRTPFRPDTHCGRITLFLHIYISIPTQCENDRNSRGMHPSALLKILVRGRFYSFRAEETKSLLQEEPLRNSVSRLFTERFAISQHLDEIAFFNIAICLYFVKIKPNAVRRKSINTFAYLFIILWIYE